MKIYPLGQSIVNLSAPIDTARVDRDIVKEEVTFMLFSFEYLTLQLAPTPFCFMPLMT